MNVVLPPGEKIEATVVADDFDLLRELAEARGKTFAWSGSGSVVTTLESAYLADGTALLDSDADTINFQTMRNAIAPFIEPLGPEILPTEDELLQVSFSTGQVEPGKSQRGYRWHSDHNITGIMVASALPPEIASGELDGQVALDFEEQIRVNQPDNAVNEALRRRLLEIAPFDELDLIRFSAAHIHRSALNKSTVPIWRDFLRVRKHSRN